MTKFNPKAWKKNKEKRDAASSGGSRNFFKIPKGKSYWKLMPPKNSELPFQEEVLYFLNDENGNLRAFKGEPNAKCLFMKTYIALKNADQPAKVLGRFKPTNKFFYNVVNVKTGEIGILQVGSKLQKDLDSGIDDKIDEGVSEELFDLDSPYVLKIQKTGEKWHEIEYKGSFVKLKKDELNIPDDIEDGDIPDLQQINISLEDEEKKALLEDNLEMFDISLDELLTTKKKAKKKKVKKELVEDLDEDEELKDTKEDDIEDIDDLEEDEEFEKTLEELEG